MDHRRRARLSGITIIDKADFTCQCDRCRQRWSPMLRSGGRLPARWWMCPEGCNRPA